MQDPDFNSLHEIMGKELSPTKIQEGNLKNYPIWRGMRMYVYIYTHLYRYIRYVDHSGDTAIYTKFWIYV